MKIKAFRIELGHGTGDFAKICGLYSKDIEAAERSKHQPPHRVLHKIMLAFNLPSSFFLTGNPKWTRKKRGIKTDPVCGAIGYVEK